jgi:hypothetical protein
MPWLQTPVPFATTHWALLVHCTGTQVLLKQVWPATQSAGEEHDVRHDVESWQM